MYRFNICSWVLIVIYLMTLTTMEFFSYKFSLESAYFSLPLVAAFIFWSERASPVFQEQNTFPTKKERFNQDLFFISFSFFSGYLLSLLFQYNNSDALGWWPIAIYFSSAIGFLFALVFSVIALILNNHKRYTLIYSIVLILALMFLSLMMHLNHFSFFARDEGYYGLLLILLGLHLLLCISYRTIYRR